MATDSPRWQVWIDRGGTFTDCIGRDPEGALRVIKVLSSDRAPLEGIRALLDLDPEAPIPPIELKMGTTLATNALLERSGRDHALLITRGFGDLLEIGNQQRSDLFDVRVAKPSVLYGAVEELDERVSADGEVLTPLDPDRVDDALRRLLARGVESLAVVLLHGYAFPAHERLVAERARALGFRHVALSHEVSPELGFSARGDTTSADAYLTPLLIDYLALLARELPGSELLMMQSSGGLVAAERFRGHNAVLSGPAAGVVACARIGDWYGYPQVIGFDMGGTSTDVSRYGGRLERSYESVTAGVRLKAPMIDLHTVAAGGGSLCRLRSGRLVVGPESAGADPGPLCYGLRDERGDRRASEPAITDINLFLGRIQPENFPFELERGPVEARLAELRDEAAAEGLALSELALAEGFIDVLNVAMAEAVKRISVARGHDVREHVLACFGGAGGQHACAVARQLGIATVIVHPYAGVLSAYGIGCADSLWQGSAPVPHPELTPSVLTDLGPRFEALARSGGAALAEQGFAPEGLRTTRLLDLRYRGTETALTLEMPEDGDALAAFRRRHRQLYGYVREGRPVEILQCRVEVAGLSDVRAPAPAATDRAPEPEPLRRTPVAFAGAWIDTPVYRRDTLRPGARLHGPALILEAIGTVVLEPGFDAEVDAYDNLLLRRTGAQAEAVRYRAAERADPVALEAFHHLFMSIAEQMGTVLRQTSVSTNIKERLDFSCALFDRAGNLVANAPHMPVHLGAMGESVRAVLERWPHMAPGDVFVTNDPYGGGSHLPDLTVVTPVFEDDALVFFVASRAHHADVGGVTPGSMPAFSTTLDEEGVLLDCVRLVAGGDFDEERFERLFSGGRWPARNLGDNRADLEAQIAANNAGVGLLHELVAHHGLATVQVYMGFIRANAARSVRDALQRIDDGVYAFADAMDDGTAVGVTLTVAGDRATLDFGATGPESAGNLNAPPAVVRAAALYALRCLVDEAIPLNDGCLEPIELIIPAPSLVSPRPGRAVAGGNVETSQRLVDVLLAAFELAAASQGTMNNVTFGDDSFGHYETICGGVGAAEGYHGASAVHTHMTNTRITDPEVLETRHPVRLTAFGVRRGSGGAGRWRGGDGAIRRFRFLRRLQVSLLTQRRNRRPFGLHGGEPGAAGRNVRVRLDGSEVELEGADGYVAEAGEELIVMTPGGGGYGAPEGEDA
jgi:5-oxoprolinase (ATP-hydrolysing)